MQTILHINQHAIRSNAKNGLNAPVITAKTYKSNDYAHEAVIRDADGNEVCRVVYRPDDPLSCGAKVWVTTQLDVELITRETDGKTEK